MCGILACLLHPNGSFERSVFQRALDSMKHRGPDDAGIWLEEAAGICLGHRRLSILDLSEAGHQPMVSGNGRWHITYNGEIYNWQSVRSELESIGVAFKTRTDTEVLLEAVDRWGVDTTLKRIVGMFAFALWDAEKRELCIARDRIGEKPLYYGWKNSQWWIASELKALAKLPHCRWTLDRCAIQQFLRCGYILTPYSIFEEIRKLQPGHYAVLKSNGDINLNCYWNFYDVVQAGLRSPFPGNESECIDELERLLTDTIQMQTIADVPVGAFLSGGIDSSTVVALMQKKAGVPVKSFSIGFEDKNYDESQYAASVARHLGTDHTEMTVRPRDAQEVIPHLVDIYDEPYADSSAIPTIIVSQLARRHVTVSLSGDAGDEIFGGYTRYPLYGELWRNLSSRSELLRAVLSACYGLGGTVSRAFNLLHWADRFEYRKCYCNIRSFKQLYYYQMMDAHSLDKLLPDLPSGDDAIKDFAVEDVYQHAMAVDTMEYLPDDILVKVDRAAMSCSLETRVPLLDHRIIEWAWRLPIQYKIHGNATKVILRRLLQRYVPAELFERPKMGFGVPVGDWVRGPLFDWAESLLSESALKTAGVLDVKTARMLWQRHVNGYNDQFRVWKLLMLQNWLHQYYC